MIFFKSYSLVMKISTLAFLLLLSWFSLNWLSAEDDGIVDYVEQRDKDSIKKMFHDDWQLLYYGDFDKISEDDFSVDFMLDNRSSSQCRANHNLILKVLRENNKTVGFVAYYPRSPYWWHMLFLMVDADHRRLGYASKLIQFMIDDVVVRGAIKVTTFTRLVNTKARSLYEDKFKFKDIGHPDNKYLDLVLYPKK